MEQKIQTTYGCHGYLLKRADGVVVIRLVRISEDEWTGEQIVNFVSSCGDCLGTPEEYLLSTGHVFVNNGKFSDLAAAVLDAVHAYADSQKQNNDVMGAGIAKQVREQCSKTYRLYRELCDL